MTQLFFKTKTTAYYMDSATHTVTQVTSVNYPAATTRGCGYMDGRFFVMTPAGAIYQSGLETAAPWAALEFTSAIIDSGTGVYLCKFHSYIFTLKEYSGEFFYDAANSTGSILGSVPSAAFKIGCASEDSVKEVSGTVVWMGQMKDGKGRAIYRLNGMSPEKISDASVEKILDADDLASVKSWVCKVGSHTLYGITLGTSAITLVFDFESGLWNPWTYLVSSGSAKTITAITAAGVATSAAHGFADGYIVKIASTNADFNGWHVVTDVTTNTFQLQGTGTVFSGSGTAQRYTEGVFPVIASTASGGVQYMQDATSGDLYTLSATTYADAVGAIAARIRTSKWDGGTSKLKRIGQTEIVGDKVVAFCLVRHADDDYVTYSTFRSVDMNQRRSRITRCGQTSRRAFELLHVKNTAFRVEALEIEVT